MTRPIQVPGHDMTQVPQDQETPSEPSRASRRGRGAVVAIAAAVEAAGFVVMLQLVRTGRLVAGLLLLQFVLSIGMLLIVLWAGGRRRALWSQPLAQLEALLPDVRRGDLPIES